MNSSSIFNVIAVVVAFGALTVSLVFAIRQTRIMLQANQLPVFIDLIREVRSENFQQAQHYVLHRLESENSSEKGIFGLPDEARLAAVTVTSFFSVFGYLVVAGVISEQSAIITMGFPANELWKKLQSFIIAERKIQGDNSLSCYFEDFVWRIRANWPPEEHYNLTIHRLDMNTL